MTLFLEGIFLGQIITAPTMLIFIILTIGAWGYLLHYRQVFVTTSFLKNINFKEHKLIFVNGIPQEPVVVNGTPLTPTQLTYALSASTIVSNTPIPKTESIDRRLIIHTFCFLGHGVADGCRRHLSLVDIPFLFK